MKKAKRLLAFGAAAMMLAASLSFPASAANTKDKPWNFSVDYSNKPYTTALREKTNASGVYVYYKEGTVNGVICDVLNSEGDSMCRKKGVVPKEARRLIAQYVYENGFRLCRLKLQSNTITISGGAGGVWSPDSAGSYPYANL